MWIFFKEGMVSIVQHEHDKDIILIRARTKAALHAFCSVIELGVIRDKDFDYEYRIFMLRSDFEKILLEKTREIDYTNFKDSITDNRWKIICNNVWATVKYYYQK